MPLYAGSSDTHEAKCKTNRARTAVNTSTYGSGCAADIALTSQHGIGGIVLVHILHVDLDAVGSQHGRKDLHQPAVICQPSLALGSSPAWVCSCDII